MRICVLAEYFHPDNTGGSGTVLSKLVRHLHDTFEGLEIDVVTSRNMFRGQSGMLAPRQNWDGVNIIRMKAPAPRKKSVKRRLAANMVFTGKAFFKLLFSRRKYDMVLVVTAPPTLPLAAKMFAGMSGTPYVYLVYDLYLDMAIQMNMVNPNSRAIRFLKEVQRGWFQSAAQTVVLGRCMRDHVSKTYGLSLDKIGVVPIPSNVEMIKPMPKDTKFRRDNGLDGFVVLYAGNFAQYQDFETLLDAAKLSLRTPEVTWVFVGDGAKKEYIQGRVKSDNLTNVRLLPFVPEEELCDMLASADVSLVTLEKGIEGLAVPSKFYNILASGRPTVACVPPASEIARVIAETFCGMQVDQENPVALAAAITKLAGDKDLLDKMGQNARRASEERYCLPRIAQQFHTIFQDVVNDSCAGTGTGTLSRPRASKLFSSGKKISAGRCETVDR